jgi:peptidoglycan/xylan/chitin deacetylase (PgdA/CDA1 family)
MRWKMTRQLRVLCYHSISDLSSHPILHPYAVPAGIFRQQIITLQQAGYTFIHPDEYFNALEFVAELPRKPILLTFDDCYSDLQEEAQPVLSDLGIGALAFAVSSRLGQENDWDQEQGAPALSLLDANRLSQLSARNFEIGAHSRTHRRLTRLSDAELEEEIAGSRRELLAAGFPFVRFFAYPNGRHDERMFPLLRSSGYVAAFTTTPGVATPATNRFAVPRLTIHPWDTGTRLLLKVTLQAPLASMSRDVRSAVRNALR